MSLSGWATTELLDAFIRLLSETGLLPIYIEFTITLLFTVTALIKL